MRFKARKGCRQTKWFRVVYRCRLLVDKDGGERKESFGELSTMGIEHVIGACGLDKE